MNTWISRVTETSTPTGLQSGASFAASFPAKINANLEASQAQKELDTTLRVLNMQLQKVMNKRITAKGRVARELARHMNQLDMFHADLSALGKNLSCTAALNKIAYVSGQMHHHLQQDHALVHGEHHDDDDVHPLAMTQSLEQHIHALPIMGELREQQALILSMMVDSKRMRKDAVEIHRELVDFGLSVALATASPAEKSRMEAKAVDTLSKEVALEVGEEAAEKGIDPAALYTDRLRTRMRKITSDAEEIIRARASGAKEKITSLYMERIAPKLVEWNDGLKSLRARSAKAMCTSFGKSESVMQAFEQTAIVGEQIEALTRTVDSVVSNVIAQPPASPSQIAQNLQAMTDVSGQLVDGVKVALDTKTALLAQESAHLQNLQEHIRQAATGHAGALQLVTELLGKDKLTDVLSQLETVQNTLSPEEQSQFLSTWIKESIGMVSNAAGAVKKELGITGHGGPDHNAFIV
jgi:hypothetical protein